MTGGNGDEDHEYQDLATTMADLWRSARHPAPGCGGGRGLRTVVAVVSILMVS